MNQLLFLLKKGMNNKKTMKKDEIKIACTIKALIFILVVMFISGFLSGAIVFNVWSYNL